MRFRKADIDALTKAIEGCEWSEFELKLDLKVYNRLHDGCDRACLQDCYVNENSQPYTSHSAVKVKLSEKALKIISDVAERVCKEPSDYMNQSDFYIGLSGQCAAAFYIYNDWRKGLESVTYGKPDQYDILLSENEKCDVKTFRWPESNRKHAPDTWMLVPLRQFEARTYPYYIACQYAQRDAIYILGFKRRGGFERVGVKVGLTADDKYSMPGIAIKLLKDLTPIKCLDCELRPSHYCINFKCKDRGGCLLDESGDPYPYDYQGYHDGVFREG